MKINFHIGNYQYLGHSPGNERARANQEGRQLSTTETLRDLLPLKRRPIMENRLRQAHGATPAAAQPASAQLTQGPSPLDRLPPELIIEIFRRLRPESLQDNPAALAQTSRDLRRTTLPMALSKLWAAKRTRQLTDIWQDLTLSQRRALIDTVMGELRSHHAAGPIYSHRRPLLRLFRPRATPVDISVEAADLSMVAASAAKRIASRRIFRMNEPLFEALFNIIEDLQVDSYKGEACHALAAIIHEWDSPNLQQAHSAMFDRLAAIIGTLKDSESKADAVDELVSSIGLHHVDPEILARQFNSVADIVLGQPVSIVKRKVLPFLIQRMGNVPEGELRVAAFQRLLDSVQDLEDAELKGNATYSLASILRSLADSGRALAEFHAVVNIIGSLQNSSDKTDCIDLLKSKINNVFSEPEHLASATAVLSELSPILRGADMGVQGDAQEGSLGDASAPAIAV